MDVTGWAADPLYSKSLLDTFVGRATRRAANERLATTKQGYGYYLTTRVLRMDISIRPLPRCSTASPDIATR